VSWSYRFKRALQEGRPRLHIVESADDLTPERLWNHSSWQLRSAETHRAGLMALEIDAERGGASGGAEVTPGSWTSSLGHWSVALVGDPSSLMRNLYPGQPVRHRMGFPGWADADYETVQLGVVWNLRMTSPRRYVLECRDILSGLQSRYTTTVGRWPLFYNLGEQGADAGATTLDGAYTAGEATVGVAATANLEGESGTGRKVVIVDPLGSVGSAFYVTYTGTGVGPIRLTGCGASTYGTTQADTATGVAVRDAAVIEDHPSDAVRKIWASTGTASANGAYDLLPASYGLGMADRAWDHSDTDVWKGYISPDTGNDYWAFLSEEQQENPIQWLQSCLSPAGVFITARQGKLTVRAAVDPNLPNANVLKKGPPEPVCAITTGDLAIDGAGRVLGCSHIAWDDSYGLEYHKLKITTVSDSTTTTESVSTHPAEEQLEISLTLDQLGGMGVYDNEAQHRAAIGSRLAPWVCRRPERLEVLLANPLFAQLAPGDLVELNFSFFGGRMEVFESWANHGWSWASEPGQFNGRRGMVVRVDPDWWGGRPTRVVVAIPPGREGAPY
jgi:hypothetical protein